MAIDLAFIDSKTERRFAKTVVGSKEEIGGVLFWNFGQVGGLHWRRHKRLFGENSIGLITDWLICPNVSNLRDREYQVSDLKQLIAIAEQTAASRGCFALHFHTHPAPSTTAPSKADLDFWWSYWRELNIAHGVVVAEGSLSYFDSDFAAVCHSQMGRDRKRTSGKFLSWRYINARIRRDERLRQKSAA